MSESEKLEMPLRFYGGEEVPAEEMWQKGNITGKQTIFEMMSKLGTREGVLELPIPGEPGNRIIPLKGIRNPIPQDPDNPLKRIRDLLQNITRTQWPTGLTIPT